MAHNIFSIAVIQQTAGGSVPIDGTDCERMTVFIDAGAGDDFDVQVSPGDFTTNGEKYHTVGSIVGAPGAVEITVPCVHMRVYTNTYAGPITVGLPANRVVKLWSTN